MIEQFRNPEITVGSKVIIGLGDSFTEGVGSWSPETYNKYNGYIDPLKIPKDVKVEMYENSWVSQICRHYLTDYIPVNLGNMGTGNRAAVKELYFNPKLKLENASDVIVVYLLSGIERFDFVNSGCSALQHHFYTMWPNPWDKNSTNKKLWEAYAETIWSEKFVLLEALLNIREAEMFCKAHGYKFIVSSAFDQRITADNFKNNLAEEFYELVDTIPWDKFLYPKNCKSFIELLLTYDGRPELAYGAFYDYYSKLKYPTDYITNCMHPTELGYKIIAEEIYEFAKSLKYI